MSAPTPYNRRHTNTDHELSDIERSLDETQAALSLIQRDDGALRNESVHVDALSPAVLALFSAMDPAKIRGAWANGTIYAQGDVVDESGNTYVCATGHTAGTFATDLAATKWLSLSDNGGLTAHLADTDGAHSAAAITVQQSGIVLTPPIGAIPAYA